MEVSGNVWTRRLLRITILADGPRKAAVAGNITQCVTVWMPPF